MSRNSSNDAVSRSDASEDARTYTVVINEEEQYSIWLADRPIPAGWRAAGKTGSKADCLQYIELVWTDMRPLSLRKWMDAEAAGGQHAKGGKAEDQPT
jgi:MbtH protein